MDTWDSVDKSAQGGLCYTGVRGTVGLNGACHVLTLPLTYPLTVTVAQLRVYVYSDCRVTRRQSHSMVVNITTQMSRMGQRHDPCFSIRAFA